MKLKNYFPLLICLAWCGCVTYAQYDNRAAAARQAGDEAFIVLKNGKTVTGHTLKHRNYDPYDGNLVRVINKPDAFTIDGKPYADDDVVVFQDKKAYHKVHDGEYLIRLISGKMSLYYFDYNQRQYNATSGYNIKHHSVYYFEKQKDQLEQVGLAALKAAVKDNPRALSQLNEYYPKDNYAKELSVEKLATVVNLYNQ